MKLKTLFLTLSLLTLVGCGKGDTSYSPKTLDPNTTYDNVYLIMGQSNASGVSECNVLQTKDPEIYQKYQAGLSKVLISYNTMAQVENNFVPMKLGFGHEQKYFGPEVGISEVLSQKEETSYIIKATEGATCLRTQYVSEKGKKLELYDKYVGFILQQLKVLENQGKNPRVRGVFWMQGESDSFLNNKEKYLDAEQYFFEYLRHDLNPWIYDYFNFVDAYIFTRGICWVEPEVINEAKYKFSQNNDHCYCIKTNGEDASAIRLSIKAEQEDEEDDLAHYDALSMLLLGKTAGEYLIK